MVTEETPENQNPNPTEGEAKPKVEPKTPPDGEKPIDPAYATRLRNETAAERGKREAAEQRAADLQTQLDEIERKRLQDEKDFKGLAEKEKKRADDIERQFNQFKDSASKRSANTELRAEAREAGILDVDDISLIDASGIKVDDDGNVTGAKEAVEAFKTSKPHKFKTEGESTPESKTKPRTPNPNPNAKGIKKDAKDMTGDEFDNAWATAGRA